MTTEKGDLKTLKLSWIKMWPEGLTMEFCTMALLQNTVIQSDGGRLCTRQMVTKKN